MWGYLYYLQFKKYIIEKNLCVDNCQSIEEYNYEHNNICYKDYSDYINSFDKTNDYTEVRTSSLETNDFIEFNTSLSKEYKFRNKLLY